MLHIGARKKSCSTNLICDSYVWRKLKAQDVVFLIFVLLYLQKVSSEMGYCEL